MLRVGIFYTRNGIIRVNLAIARIQYPFYHYFVLFRMATSKAHPNPPHRNSTLGILTSTFMAKQEAKKVSLLLQALFDNSESLEFRQPVPWKELNLFDYPTVIQHPMDLGTVKRKVNIGDYQTVEDCLDDIQLIWDNCKTYNAKGTWIYNLADKLEKNFKKMIKNYLPFINTNMKKERKEREEKKKEEKKQQAPKVIKQIQIQQPLVAPQQQPPLSIQQTTIFIPRREFLYRAAHCTTDQMGILFLLIRNNSPHCFKVVDGKVMIQSELIDDTLLKRLEGQLDMWGVGLEPAAKKK